MANNKFTVSDETLNSYGSVILTSGINIARFQRNPIMLYMHDRDKGVIGRWDNITKEGDKLTAEAVFDDASELGAKVKHQVESGFLHSASIGVENCKCETINGVQTIVECDLIEISIVDVPANENAVKLFKQGWKPVQTLFELKNSDTETESEEKGLRTRIIDVLGLPETITDKDIVEHIKALLNEPSNVEREVDEAISSGILSASDRKSFTAMAKGNIKAFRGYCKSRREALKAEIERLLDKNINKVMPMERSTFRHIGERLGIETLQSVLDTMHGPAKLSEIVNLRKDDKSRWTLEMFRKYAPDELRDNPTLYKRLVEQERGHVSAVKDLDYYRRNEPDYLAEHPDLYKQLIENEQKRK